MTNRKHNPETDNLVQYERCLRNLEANKNKKIIAGTLIRKLYAIPPEKRGMVKYYLKELLYGNEVQFKDRADKMFRTMAYRLLDSCGSLRIPVLERYEFDESGEKVIVSAKVRGNYSFVWPAIEGTE